MFLRFLLLSIFFSTNLFSQDFQKASEKARAASYSIEDNEGNVIGSGFAIKGNLIITNEHVASAIDSDNKSRVDLVFKDSLYDIAVLKSTYMNLDDYLLFSKKELNPGDVVIACGSGLGGFGKGAEGAITQGVFSANNINDDGITMLQHTAPITGGNSGGPLVNIKGELVGVNTATLSEIGITISWEATKTRSFQSLALPSSKLKFILESKSLYDDSFVFKEFFNSYKLLFLFMFLILTSFLIYVLIQNKKQKENKRENKVYRGGLYGNRK
jgi:S1-C subfamily serine protease